MDSSERIIQLAVILGDTQRTYGLTHRQALRFIKKELTEIIDYAERTEKQVYSIPPVWADAVAHLINA